jgi:hypothetical protein
VTIGGNGGVWRLSGLCEAPSDGGFVDGSGHRRVRVDIVAPSLS